MEENPKDTSNKSGQNTHGVEGAEQPSKTGSADRRSEWRVDAPNVRPSPVDVVQVTEIPPLPGVQVTEIPALPENYINDLFFIKDLERLKELRSFLIAEGAVQTDSGDSGYLSLGKLNLLKYDFRGRSPREEEWEAVEHATQGLFRLLTEPLRKRFVKGDIPQWISLLPIGFGVTGLVALVLGGIFSYQAGLVILVYLVWLTSLGAIGSIAFIGMNALSIQQDITFDLTNRRLIVLRIVLGALFGVVLSLPLGFDVFVKFCRGLVLAVIPAPTTTHPAQVTVTQQMIVLLLPFILGFSTSLVIMILNRLVGSVQAFFGAAEPHMTAATEPIAKRG